MKYERGMIVADGMGGFLKPPTHPQHTRSVQIDLNRRPCNRGRMSLSSARDCEWLDPVTRKEAMRLLDRWEKPPIDSDAIGDWIRSVLGYFRHCYLPGNGSRNASDLIIDRDRDPLEHIDTHRGVDFIREYYPEYSPTAIDFDEAYWGNKPDQ